MGWVKRLYALSEIDAAGDALADYATATASANPEYDLFGYPIAEYGPPLPPPMERHLEVIENFRSAHGYPLNIFQNTLRYRAKRIDAASLIAQRSKRLSSIRQKLMNYPDLKLSEIQDIAGCRAILTSVDRIYALAESYERQYSDHQLDTINDYIKLPKKDGYRSYHMVFRYSPDHPDWGGQKVEMQFRTQFQHCWATAVETVDIFLRERLKAHSGSPAWTRFFALMGSAIARREGCPLVRRTPRDEKALLTELRELERHLDVVRKLEAFAENLSVIGGDVTRNARIRYVIMTLDPEQKTTRLMGYRAGALDRASNDYAELEEKGTDAVLVSVSNANSLQRAFPNYFLDTGIFLGALKEFIQ